MDGGDIFIGLAVIAFAALVTVAAHWKEWMGRDIARRSQSQSYVELYEATKRQRTLSSVQRRAQRERAHPHSWTPADGNPVGYYGRMLWMQLFRHNTWKV